MSHRSSLAGVHPSAEMAEVTATPYSGKPTLEMFASACGGRCGFSAPCSHP